MILVLDFQIRNYCLLAEKLKSKKHWSPYHKVLLWILISLMLWSQKR